MSNEVYLLDMVNIEFNFENMRIKNIYNKYKKIDKYV